jgi:hypothetical protein
MAANFTDIAITSKNIDASGQDPSDPKKFIFVFNLSETAPLALQKLFAEERARRTSDAASSPLALMLIIKSHSRCTRIKIYSSTMTT